jgi:hypothetical protein
MVTVVPVQGVSVWRLMWGRRAREELVQSVG